MKPDLVFYSGAELLESPRWNEPSNTLYFVSITDSVFYGMELKTRIVKTYSTKGHVGCVLIEKNGHIISAEKEGIFNTSVNTGIRKLLAHPEVDPAMRYNDGVVDSLGRIIVGTKGYVNDVANNGRVFSIYKGQVNTIIQGTTISNGLGFSHDGKKLYFIDTPTRKVAEYVYDIDTGNVFFHKYVIEIPGPGLPDGLCVDRDGNIWVAEWGGSCVCLWNPINGKKIKQIKLPCTNVTSCCLAERNNETLFITTARNGIKKEIMAGGLFACNVK
jgi:sugar lactone lactonase YvrE